MRFRIGQKVVCVNDGGQICGPGDMPVVKDRIYTVRGFNNDWGGHGVLLEEHLNPLDRPYRRRRFRPVVERKTDIGFAILEEIRRRETVPADRPRVTAPTDEQGGVLS